jgi:glycosyltransferase involved in cell wall biosynthesis
MTAAPRVSVIIPTYNRADLIPQAIDSVLQQTFSDFEIIVVDDGSTDDTAAAVKAYGDRVRYVWTPNGGTGHARNVGMQHARGRYFTFLDSDDLLYPYALELQTRLLERFPAVSMVCAEMTGFDDHGFVERYHLKSYHSSTFRDKSVTYDAIFESSIPLLETGAVPEGVLREDSSVLERRAYYGNVFDSYLVGIVLFQNTAMLRREVVADIGPRNEYIYCFEELDYLLRLSRNHDVLFADVPTYKLRYHDGQISTTARSDGKYVWMRKQRVLLRVIKRHVLADQAYYQRHRQRLDRRLADLHRAVAVPMLLLGPGDARRDSYARYSRLYLARCRDYGDPQRALYAASFAPGPVRRAAVTIVEHVRRDGVAAVARRAFTAVMKKGVSLLPAAARRGLPGSETRPRPRP